MIDKVNVQAYVSGVNVVFLLTWPGYRNALILSPPFLLLSWLSSSFSGWQWSRGSQHSEEEIRAHWHPEGRGGGDDKGVRGVTEDLTLDSQEEARKMIPERHSVFHTTQVLLYVSYLDSLLFRIVYISFEEVYVIMYLMVIFMILVYMPMGGVPIASTCTLSCIYMYAIVFLLFLCQDFFDALSFVYYAWLYSRGIAVHRCVYPFSPNAFAW